MPFLPDEESTDKLLKNLGMNLMQQFGIGDLKDFGWFQYRDHDHLKSLVAVELAADAFLYLSFAADGSWRRNPKVLTAVIAFMARYGHRVPQSRDLVRLKQLIETQPHNPQVITHWFRAMYPPVPAPK